MQERKIKAVKFWLPAVVEAHGKRDSAAIPIREGCSLQVHQDLIQEWDGEGYCVWCKASCQLHLSENC